MPKDSTDFLSFLLFLARTELLLLEEAELWGCRASLLLRTVGEVAGITWDDWIGESCSLSALINISASELD